MKDPAMSERMGGHDGGEEGFDSCYMVALCFFADLMFGTHPKMNHREVFFKTFTKMSESKMT